MRRLFLKLQNLSFLVQDCNPVLFDLICIYLIHADQIILVWIVRNRAQIKIKKIVRRYDEEIIIHIFLLKREEQITKSPQPFFITACAIIHNSDFLCRWRTYPPFFKEKGEFAICDNHYLIYFFH